MNENKPNKVPNAEATSTGQINNLLSIGSFCLHALIRPSPSEIRVDIPKEAEIAAENTFIKVLSTFDALLDEQTRWSMAAQQKLAARFDEAHDLNMAFLRDQARFAYLTTTPHFRFKPNLVRLDDGRIVAMLGRENDLGNAIMGVGATVEEAMYRFDEVCRNGVPAKTAEYLEKREADLNAGKTPEPYPIKNEEKPIQSVDDKRPKPAGEPSKRRKNKPRNS